jgi:hypothetical protein
MVLVALGTLLIAIGGFEAYRLLFAFDSKEGLRIFRGRSPPRMSRPINYFFRVTDYSFSSSVGSE